MEYIRSSIFSEAERLELTSFISTASFGPSTAGTSGTPAATAMRELLKPQEHLYVHDYLSEVDWGKLRNQSTPIGVKVDTIVNKCGIIGLYSVTEKTARAICSIVVVAHGQPCDHSQAYDVLQVIKSAFKMMRSRRSATQKPTLSKFPPSTKEFIQFAGNVFGEDPADQPIGCPIDVNMIMQLRESMPCRKTHNALKTPLLQMPSPKASGNIVHGGGLQQALQNIVAPLTHALMNQTPQLAALTDFVTPPKAKGSHLLAIADGQADSASSAAASPADAHAVHPDSPPVDVPAASLQLVQPVQEGKKTLSGAVSAIQAAMGSKRKYAEEETVRESDEEAADGGTSAGAAADKAAKAGRGMGKCEGKGRGRAGKGRGRGRAGRGRGGHIAPKAAGKAKAASSGAGKSNGSRPPRPPHKKMPPVQYLTCKVYTDAKNGTWRAVEKSNPRKDVKFRWCKDGWDRCMEWCEENSK